MKRNKMNEIKQMGQHKIIQKWNGTERNENETKRNETNEMIQNQRNDVKQRKRKWILRIIINKDEK